MIDNLKDLQRLLKLCRKQGVKEIKLGAVEIKLGDLPFEVPADVVASAPPVNPYAGFPDGLLSQEQLMFYSSGGMPDDDPENKAN